MRFSLRTLILLILWCGLAMLVWQRREPWVLSPREYSRDELIPLLPPPTDAHRQESPDGTRTFSEGGSGDSKLYLQCEDGPTLVLYDSADFPATPLRFLNDNTLLVGLDNRLRPFRFFHRRHPEWWWGHFYRPEVWVLCAYSALLLIAGIRKRRRVSDASDTPT